MPIPRPVLRKKWWDKNRPRALRRTRLGEALGNYDRLYSECRREGPGLRMQLFRETEEAIADLEHAVEDARQECRAHGLAEMLARLDDFDVLMTAAKRDVGVMKKKYEQKVRAWIVEKRKCLEDIEKVQKAWLQLVRKKAAVVRLCELSTSPRGQATSKKEANGLLVQIDKLGRLIQKCRREFNSQHGAAPHEDDQRDLRPIGTQINRIARDFINQREMVEREIREVVENMELRDVL